MPDDDFTIETPVDMLALGLVALAPRARVLPLVSKVSWVTRAKPFPETLEAAARLEARVRELARPNRSGAFVDVAGPARVTVGTSAHFTALVVLVACAGHPSRIVILPIE